MKLCDDSLRVDVCTNSDDRSRFSPCSHSQCNANPSEERKKKEKFYSPRMDYARSVKMIVERTRDEEKYTFVQKRRLSIDSQYGESS